MQEVIKFIRAALECSIFLAPREPGLTYDEILEIGKRAGFQEGEIGDAIGHATTAYIGVPKLLPDDDTIMNLVFFLFSRSPITGTLRRSILLFRNSPIM